MVFNRVYTRLKIRNELKNENRLYKEGFNEGI